MKKIISFVCVIALFCTMLFFVTPVSVSAASDWKGWTTTKGSYTELSDGSRKLSGDSEITYTYVWRPKKYAIEFSAKVTKPSNSIGLQAKVAWTRPGGYIRNGYFQTMSGGHRVTTSGNCDGAFHTYRLEIDHTQSTQTVYYDGVYAGVQPLEVLDSNYWLGDTYTFWVTNGGEMEVKEVSFTSLMNGQGAEFPVDYTEEYFEDFETLDYCRVPEGNFSKYVTHDAENGTVQIYREKVHGIETYVERPLKATKNFDLEFRMKLIKVDESLNQGTVSIRIATDERYTWLSISADCIGFNGYGEFMADPSYTSPAHGIPYSIGYDWFDIKGEFRDKWVTWYIKKDGDTEYKELVNYKVRQVAMDLWQTGVGSTYSQANWSGGMIMDWQKYTPYNELNITYPVSNAVYNEGDEILFGTNIGSLGDTTGKRIDYYLNGFKVGAADAWSAFFFRFKNAKQGVYNLYAVCSDGKISNETTFIVKKAQNVQMSQKIIDDLGIAIPGEADDTWYTYRITVGDFNGSKSFADNHDEFVKVYRKVRGEADSQYVELTGIKAPSIYTLADIENIDYMYCSGFSTLADMLFLGYYNAKLSEKKSEEVKTEYSIDNLQIGDDLAYSGTVTATDAEIFVDSLEAVESVMLASYDEKGRLIDIDFAELDGGTNFADLNIKSASITKLFIWSGLTGGKPLLGMPVEIK